MYGRIIFLTIHLKDMIISCFNVLLRMKSNAYLERNGSDLFYLIEKGIGI